MKYPLVLMIFATALAGRTLGAEITYQGRLTDNGGPASGLYDLRFTLCDSVGDPGMVAGPVTNSAVAVSSGIFTTTLDFGHGVFTGRSRWLEISARTNGGETFTLLSPRQALTFTPHAMFASTASNLVSGAAVKSLNAIRDDVTLVAGANVVITSNGNTLTIDASGAGGTGVWGISGTNTFYNNGSIGLGTATPTSKLDIVGAQDSMRITAFQPILTLRDTGAGNARGVIQGAAGGLNFFSENYLSGANLSAFLRLDGGGGVGIGTATPQGKLDVSSGGGSYVRVDSQNGDLRANGGADSHFGIINEGSAAGTTQIIGQGVVRLAVANTGNVGIGTVSPASKLEVRGDVRLGTSGQYFAPGAEENLRLLRGIVATDGSASVGCCYSVNRPATGTYDITFTTPFAGTPVVTATPPSSGLTTAVVTPTTTGVRIVVDANHTSTNSGFHFIAIGPR